MPRTDAELTTLLTHRPELAAAGSLDLLERMLASPDLAVPALLELDADCHTVSQALQVLGGRAERAELKELLDDPHGRLDEVLGTLAEWGLVTMEGETVLSPHQPGLWEHPFGLGRPLREVARDITAETLKSMLQALGAVPAGRKAELVTRVEERLREDPRAVAARAAKLPRQARALLEQMAAGRPVLSDTQAFYGDRGDGPLQRLAEAGFVVRADWEYEMPREVALALREEGWKPRLTGQPEVAGVARPAADGVGAALAAVDKVAALVELAGAEPIAELKAGGVGARELKRLGRALRLPEPEVVLWLDVAFGADLLAPSMGDGLVATTVVDEWLAAEPDARWEALAEAWRALPHSPTHRVLGCCEEHLSPQAPPHPFDCGAGDVRRATLRVLHSLPAGLGADAAGLRAAVDWRTRATAEFELAATEFVAATLDEGELLGMVAAGGLTALGRAVLDGDPPAPFFPAPATTATLQNDLTAVVTGAPAHELAAFLSGCADLESRDRASVWRFSGGSVRRALDAGVSPDDLLAELERISAKSVPQPLRYLVADTARRHGAIRVAPAASVVTADDPALVAELCGARSLRKLGLRQVAPTVALGGLAPDETLRLLRAAGYAPVGEAADGTIRAERPRKRRLPVDPLPGQDLDPAAAAQAIRDGRSADPPGGDAVRDASLTGEPIVIVRRGREHLMDDLRPSGQMVTGYCHDCDGGHTFGRAEIEHAYLLAP
ncbi:helicase-associated domain-containing protein [Nonomuraea sp. LPB2021202275-12-8]|uniref:helicase-associated domain-containing protein n=1 Tax=Nonomuraea sp. LPB2021202275-12-8 TaxID=3120159 RepID=UPI00300C5F6A